MRKISEYINLLKTKKYLGRGIILGKNKHGDMFTAYFLSGRSPSSRARKLEKEDGAVVTSPTNEKTLLKGTPSLLIYKALFNNGRYIIVGNGAQTGLIDSILSTHDIRYGGEAFLHMFSIPSSHIFDEMTGKLINLTEYEPDGPIFTPRITAIINRSGEYYMQILSRFSGSNLNTMYSGNIKDINNGVGMMISTYEGSSDERILPFSGSPVLLDIPYLHTKEIAEALYDSINYVISVAVLIFNPSNKEADALTIINS